MNVFAISDLHISGDGAKPMDVFGGKWVGYLPKIVADWNKKVSDDDVVLICGDISWAMNLPEQDRKIYLRETERLKLALSAAEKVREGGDEIYCMVHFPPFNVRRENSLFTDLFESKGVSKVIYGHLHGSDSRTDLKIVKNGVEYYLTSCDQVNNELTLIGEFL